MIALLRLYWYFPALAAMGLLLGVQTYRIASLKAHHAEYVAEAAAARAEAIARVIVQERAAARISEQKAEEHEKTITALRAAAARRLQAQAGAAAVVPRVPDAPFKPDETPGGDRLSISLADAIALMLAADENTQQLVDLQAWVRAVRGVP